MPCTTSGQETERVYSYNPGARTGKKVKYPDCIATKNLTTFYTKNRTNYKETTRLKNNSISKQQIDQQPHIIGNSTDSKAHDIFFFHSLVGILILLIIIIIRAFVRRTMSASELNLRRQFKSSQTYYRFQFVCFYILINIPKQHTFNYLSEINIFYKSQLLHDMI